MSRRAFTLVELLLVLVLMGVLAALGLAPIRALRDGASVRVEARHLVESLDLARGAAVRLGVATQLYLSDTGYVVRAIALTGEEFVVSRRAGAGSRGIQLTGASGVLQFGPSGLALGVSNRTLTLRRGGVVRTVVVSRLGRITS